MAKQKGIIPLEGTIGNITFLKTKDGYRAKQKSEISAQKIATDPAFQRTRENNAEFGRAAKAGKLLRTAFRSLIQKAKDHIYVGRVTQKFKEIINMDLTNPRGQRNVIDGEAELLLGFEFNSNAKLSTTLFAPSVATINRVTGELKVELAAFIPADMITVPQGATHFKICSAGASIDFENNLYDAATQETGYLPIDQVATAPISLANMVTPNSTHPLVLVMGVQLFQHVNGNYYPLKNGVFNCLSVVKVDTP